jgi:glycosyltransferase involved in cell wall biosynthesis
MPVESKPSFAFLVLAYNHQDYILEHLESIKYLVQTYAQDIDVDLIVNDDCSKDQTRNLVDAWLQLNANLFRHLKKIYNPKNLGTCASVNNMLDHMVAERCKLTAGDDVYSFENIFELTQHEGNVAMVSGRALHLLGDDLGMDHMANRITTATQVIYQNDSLLHRFKHLSYSNAPNLFYATKCVMHPDVRAYLRRFDVVEDWPLQVAIAEHFPKYQYQLIDEVLVYYRRTMGSAYIVANQRFVQDKIQVYEDLIFSESSWFERLRIQSRLYCFKRNNKYINKLMNIDFLIFAVLCLFHLRKIIKSKIDKSVILKHGAHLERIRKNKIDFLSNQKFNQ